MLSTRSTKKESIDFIPVKNNEDESKKWEKRSSSSKTSKKSLMLDEYSSSSSMSDASQVTEQIQSDKRQTISILNEFALDRDEIIHLLEQWTHHLLFTFQQNREKFKMILKEKWERGELTSLQAEEFLNRKIVFTNRQKLLTWIDKSSSSSSSPPSNIKLKDFVDQSIEQLLEILSSVSSIHQCYSKEFSTDPTKSIESNHSIDETIDHLQRLKEINNKDYNTVCIIGLEKAGKSSFINALLGFELLPFRIERCTQIQTILKPIDRRNVQLYARIEFYNDEEFENLFVQIPQLKDESEEMYQRRLTTIRRTREKILPENSLHRDYFVANDEERMECTHLLHQFIADQLYLIILKHVIIYTDRLPGENYILLDVPGCDSPIREHYESALDAIRRADAFLFLTDGQRPSLTKNQLDLLNEIQRGHYQGMRRAFGIITKLDLCQTYSKYREHEEKTRLELEEKHFLREQIFSVASNISLLRQTQSDRSTLELLQERIQSYGSLIHGFDQCKQSLNRFIEYELPHIRYRLIEEMVQQKIISFVRQAIEMSNEMIPMDRHRQSFDEYIREINGEKWNGIYQRERYEPTFQRAVRWQKETLALHRTETSNRLKEFFSQRFLFHSKKFLDEIHRIEELVLEQFDINPSQMDILQIENDQRKSLVYDLFQIVRQTSNDLSRLIFENYLQHLENLLNDICREDGTLFRGILTLSSCATELKTLIVRSTNPLISATLRWSYTDQTNRRNSAKEFLRIAPIIAFNLLDEQRKSSDSTSIYTITKTLQLFIDELRENGQTNDVLLAIFRR